VSPEFSLLLPFDQFLFSELRQIDEGQRLRALFVSHEVTLIGTGLHRIEVALQRAQLSYMACVPTHFHTVVADEQPVIRRIVVTEAKATDSATVA